MKVVSDTSPICYLVLIGHIDLLPALFGRVAIPPAVRDELSNPMAVSVLRRWIGDPPAWLEVQPTQETSDPGLLLLDPGEREAIVLAESLRADLILLDEKRARRMARERGLAFTGLIGVLAQAIDRGLISATEAVERLQRTSFRADPALYHRLLVSAKDT